jgi:hypothetical protein
VKCLYLDNGTLEIKKVFDLNDILVASRGPKVLAWAKGKPILSRVRGLKGVTWLLCPELAFSLDESGMVALMRKGKAYLLKKMLDRLVELGNEVDGITELKAQTDRMTALQSELDEKAKQLVQAEQVAAKESADRIAAEARLQSEMQARQRAEASAQQERDKLAALQHERIPDRQESSDESRGSQAQKPPTKKKTVKGAERLP